MKHRRLIDADALIAQFDIWGDQDELSVASIRTEIENAPTIEPDILTCEDCKYADDKPISDGRYWCGIYGSFMYYCSDAERREE